MENDFFIYLNDDMTFEKCQINFFNIILIATLAFKVPAVHSICHVDYFR